MLAKSLGFSQENIPLESFLEEFTESVDRVSDEKIYLNHLYLEISEQGIILFNKQNRSIRIPTLFSDNAGVYLQLNKDDFSGSHLMKCSNPNCGRLYYVTPSSSSSNCPSCGSSPQ